MTPLVSDPDLTRCECGCGEPAPIAGYSHAARGWVKGQPKRFVTGHNAKLARRDLDASYIVEDRGYETPCWIWQGYIDESGYGRFNVDGVPQLAHRVYFMRARGWLPSVLHHRCRTRSCVNPEHTQPTTHGEHRAIEAAAQTHCTRGHSFAEHGRLRANGTRCCRECERITDRRRRAAAR